MKKLTVAQFKALCVEIWGDSKDVPPNTPHPSFLEAAQYYTNVGDDEDFLELYSSHRVWAPLDLVGDEPGESRAALQWNHWCHLMGRPFDAAQRVACIHSVSADELRAASTTLRSRLLYLLHTWRSIEERATLRDAVGHSGLSCVPVARGAEL